jgi:hypothetical protein
MLSIGKQTRAFLDPPQPLSSRLVVARTRRFTRDDHRDEPRFYTREDPRDDRRLWDNRFHSGCSDDLNDLDVF